MNNDKLEALFSGLTTVPQAESKDSRDGKTPAKKEKKKSRTKKAEEKPVESRFCTIVDNEVLKKIRLIATKEGLNVKDVVGAAFEKAISSYERKHGKLQEEVHDAKKIF